MNVPTISEIGNIMPDDSYPSPNTPSFQYENPNLPAINQRKRKSLLFDPLYRSRDSEQESCSSKINTAKPSDRNRPSFLMKRQKSKSAHFGREETISNLNPKERHIYPEIKINEGIEDVETLAEVFPEDNSKNSILNMESFRTLVDSTKFPMRQEETNINTTDHLETATLNTNVEDRWKKIIKRVIFKNKFKDLHLEINAARSRCQRNLGCQVRKKSNIIITSCVIMPSTKFQLIWSLVMVLALSYTAIFVPYRLAFIEEHSLGFSILEYFVDGIFFADLICTFFTAFYDNEHKLVTNKKLIAKNYLKGWFLIDLIACDESANASKTSNSLRLLRMIRLYRILKIFKIIRSLKIVKGSILFEKFIRAMKMNAGFKRLIKATIIFLILMHFFACAWFYEARLFDFQPDTWVVRYGVKDLNNSKQYLMSLCWVMTLSTIGYGDIMPFTLSERILAMIFTLVGIAFVTYYIGSLSSLMLSTDSKTQKLKKKLLILDELAHHLDIESDLYHRIRKIIRSNHETSFYSDMSHESIMEELPTNLRIQLLSLIFDKNNLHSIAFFSGKSPYFIADILPLLKRITLEKDEVIYGQGDWIDEMYFVLKGTVKTISGDHFINKTFMEGTYFGEQDIVANINFRDESAIAAEKCELLTLQKCDLLALFTKHSEIQTELENNIKIEKQNTPRVFAKTSDNKVDENVLRRLTTMKHTIFHQPTINPSEEQRGMSRFCPTYDTFMEKSSEIEDSSLGSKNSFTESELSDDKSESPNNTRKNTLSNPLFLLKDNSPTKHQNQIIIEVNEEAEEESSDIVFKEESKSAKSESSSASYQDETLISEIADKEINNKFVLYDFQPHNCSLKDQYKRPVGNLPLLSVSRAPTPSEIFRGNQNKNNYLLSPRVGSTPYVRRINTPLSYQLSTETLSKSSRYSIFNRLNSIENNAPENDITKRLDVLYFQMKRNKVTMKQNIRIQREMWNQFAEKINILISTLTPQPKPKYFISQSRKTKSLLNLIPD